MEADENKRREYLENISKIKKEDIIYIDESGIYLNEMKDRGWGRKGQIIKDKKKGRRSKRINIIAGLCNKKIVMPVLYEMNCNKEIFNKWIEMLITTLKPNQVVVMDNASFHKSSEVQRLIESVGCKLIYLPPYSPDLNPIEKFWSVLKKWFKQKIYEKERMNEMNTKCQVN